MNSIFASDEFKKIREFEKGKRKKYWSTNRECFARAYAQFIAEESKDKRILKELMEAQKGNFPSQWNSESFKPIHKAFKELFKEKGWLR